MTPLDQILALLQHLTADECGRVVASLLPRLDEQDRGRLRHMLTRPGMHRQMGPREGLGKNAPATREGSGY